MKCLAALALLLGVASAFAALPEISNEHLLVRASDHPGTLLGYVGSKSVNQLHEEARSDGLLAGLESGEAPREGMQIFVVPPGGGEPVALQWQMEEQLGSALRFRDTSGRWQALVSLLPGACAVDLELSSLEKTPPQGRLELTWYLQVGGDFLAVTTEGVADVETVPTVDRGTGAPRLQVAQIDRDQTVSYQLSQPWFAVSDRNQSVTFGVWFDASGGAALRGWSGQLLGREAMSRTLSLPAPASPVRVRMMLVSPLNAVAAIFHEGVLRWSAQGQFVFLPVQPLGEGEVRLTNADASPQATGTLGAPLQPLAIPVSDRSTARRFELHTRNGVQTISLLE